MILFSGLLLSKNYNFDSLILPFRIYNDKVEQLLAHFEENRPDVVILHSNIWDSTRYSNDDRISLTQFALR